MKNSEVKEYLNTFPDDADICLILANPRERKRYEVVNMLAISDYDRPVFIIDVGQAIDMDEEEKKVCEECESEDLDGQMNIDDFPEVLP